MLRSTFVCGVNVCGVLKYILHVFIIIFVSNCSSCGPPLGVGVDDSATLGICEVHNILPFVFIPILKLSVDTTSMSDLVNTVCNEVPFEYHLKMNLETDQQM